MKLSFLGAAGTGLKERGAIPALLVSMNSPMAMAGERSIRIHGEDVTINAEVVSLPGMSAHADAGQLVHRLATAPRPPRGVYLNHGEAGPADALRLRIERALGWSAIVPRLGQSVEIA